MQYRIACSCLHPVTHSERRLTVISASQRVSLTASAWVGNFKRGEASEGFLGTQDKNVRKGGMVWQRTRTNTDHKFTRPDTGVYYRRHLKIDHLGRKFLV